MIPSISATEFKTYCEENDPYILDVRTHFEYSDGHIEGAVNLPVSYIAYSIDEIPKDRPILIYCLHGVRSLKAGTYLHLKGFENVVHLEGGLDALE